MKYTYYQYGLKIKSEFELRDLPDHGDAPYGEVQITKGAISKINLGEEIAPNAWGSTLNTTVFHQGIGFSKAIGGLKIILDENLNSLTTFQSVFTSSHLLSLLLVQRGFLVLHASAVAINERALLFTGAGGSGKSSLAVSLAKNGATHLADDVCPVFFSDTGHPFIFENSKGWYALKNPGKAEGEKIYQKLSSTDSQLNQYPVDFIFSLNAGNLTTDKELSNLDSFKAILSNLWFPVFSQKALGKHHLSLVAKLQSKIRTIELQRDINSASWVKWNSSVNHFLDALGMSSPKSFSAIDVC